MYDTEFKTKGKKFEPRKKLNHNKLLHVLFLDILVQYV